MNDIDLAVTRGAIPALARALEQTGWQILQVIPYEVGAYFFIAVRAPLALGQFLCLDVIMDFRDRGRLYLRGSELLANRAENSGLPVASPESEFAYLLVKKILKGAIPEHQRLRLNSLSTLLGHRAEENVERLFGRQNGGLLLSWLRNCNWVQLQSNIFTLQRALRRTALARYFGRSLLGLLMEIKRLLGRILRPTGFMVAMLGPDGSGKTTAARYVQHAFVPTNGRVRYFHFRPDVLRRNISDVDPDPHGRPCRGTAASIVKLLYLLCDHIIGYLFLVRPRLVRSDLVVFDRYFSDLVIDPIRYRFGAPLWTARLAAWFVPQPDLFIVLDAPEKQLQARKPELRTAELEVLRSRYHALAASLKNAVLLDASNEQARVAQAVSSAICERLHGRYLTRRIVS